MRYDLEGIEKIAVIGAGLMGHGLALVHAMGGHKVKMQDISNDPL